MCADFTFDKAMLIGFAPQVNYKGQMVLTRYERENKTESYVTIPPAYTIHDSDGAVWMFGNEYVFGPDGYYEFNVLRNGVDMDVVAQRIEYRKGVVWIFSGSSSPRWRHFSRSRRHFI